MTTSLRSSRLCLDRLELDDVSETYVAWLNDPMINRYLETRHSPQTLESCRAFVDASLQDPATHLMKITLTATGQHIGNIKIGPINRSHQTAALSLFIGDRASQGQGLATEAIRCMTDWALTDLGLYRVEAGCYDANLGSLRAFLKAGYEVEGFFRKARVDDQGQRVGMFWMAKLKG